MGQVKKIAPAVDWKCSDCGTELGVPHLVGKRKEDRRVVCSKCAKQYEGVRDERTM